MKKQKIDYKIRVYTLPDDLKISLKENQEHLETIKRIYQLAIDLKIIWPIWMIDEYDKKWIEIEFENEKGKDEWHSLAIDEGTYRKIASDEYEVIMEK